jgi:hypothetical protein
MREANGELSVNKTSLKNRTPPPINPHLPRRANYIKKKPPTLMRHLLLRSLAGLACLGVFSLPQTSAVPKADRPDKPNFSGTWTLDLKASAPLEPLMNQIGGSLLERKYAASTGLKATFDQTEDVLTVVTRGPGFALDETAYLDGRTDPSNLEPLGATSLQTRTAWSEDHKQLVETHQTKTKQGKEGQLTIKRYLIDEGKTMVVAFAPELNAEQNKTSAPPNVAQASLSNQKPAIP